MIKLIKIKASNDYFINLFSVSENSEWMIYFESKDYKNEIQKLILENKRKKILFQLQSDFQFTSIDYKIAPLFLSDSILALNYQNSEKSYGVLIFDFINEIIITQLESFYAVNKSHQGNFIYLLEKTARKFCIYNWENGKTKNFSVLDAGLNPREWEFDQNLCTPSSDSSEQNHLLCISSEKYNENRIYTYHDEKGFKFKDLRNLEMFNLVKPFYHPLNSKIILSFVINNTGRNSPIQKNRTFSLISINTENDTIQKTKEYHLFPDGNISDQINLETNKIVQVGISLQDIPDKERCFLCIDGIVHSKEDTAHILLEIDINDLTITVLESNKAYKRYPAYIDERTILYLEKGKVKILKN